MHATKRPRGPLLPRLVAEADHWPALRVGTGLAVPGAVLLAAGHPEAMIHAVFGSFTGMYGSGEAPLRRLRHQLQAGALLAVAFAVGLALSVHDSPVWLLAGCAVAYGSAGSLVADRMGLKPAGPFFGIFALGAIAMLPAGAVDAGRALAIYASTALWSVAVGQLPCFRARPAAAPRGGPGPEPDASRAGTLLRAARYALALAAASGAASLLHLGHVNWALAGAAVPLAAATGRTGLRRGVHRVAGTAAGLVVTALLLWADLPPAARAAVVVLLLFPTEMFMARHYGLALGFFTPLIMLMTELADPMPAATLLGERIAGTLVGVAAGLAVLLGVGPPRARRPDGLSPRAGGAGR